MRVLVALGGNALLKRGEPMTAEVQRANVQTAARALAPVAEHHQLVLSHGNGPQVGLARPAGRRVQGGRGLPAGRARRPDRGDDRLPDRAGARQPAAGRGARSPRSSRWSRSTPTIRRSTTRRSSSARSTTTPRPRRSPPRRAGSFKRDGDHLRRVVPSPAPQADLRDPPDPLAARARRARDLRRRRGDPDDVGARQGAHARRRRGRDRQGPRQRAVGQGDRGRPLRDGDRRRRRLRRTGERRSSAGSTGSPRTSCAARPFAAGSMGPKVDAAARFVEATGKRAAIGCAGGHRADRRGQRRHQRRAASRER